MRDLRAILNSISPGSLVIPIALAALLVTMSLSGVTAEVDQARCSMEDWEAAVVAFEDGATNFQGSCVGAGISEPGVDIGFAYEARDQARRDFEAAVERLTADPWQRAAGAAGGVALVFLALYFGGLATGSPLGSVVAAWALSNGWTRKAWARSTLTLVTLVTLLGYLLALAVVMVVVYTRITGAGVDFAFPAPTAAALAPIPGLLYFAMAGTLVGLLLGRELGGITAIGLGIADFILGGLLASRRTGELPPYLPTTWHQTALESNTSALTIPMAAGLSLAAAVVVAAFVYWLMTGRRDIPDR